MAEYTNIHMANAAIDILRADLAKANARIAELENKNSYNLQIVREATARVGELEAAVTIKIASPEINAMSAHISQHLRPHAIRAVSFERTTHCAKKTAG